jgi:hypothetical protein
MWYVGACLKLEVFIMALIKCPDCGKNVSSNAEACIGCGAPLKRQKTRTDNVKVTSKRAAGSYEAIGTLLILGGMVTAMATGPDNHIGGLAAGAGALVFFLGRFK